MTTYLKNPNRWVVAAAAVIMQTGLGSFYAWSVFREPLSSFYGANVTRVNVTFFIATLMVGFAAFGGGLLVRRIGPRVVGVAGGILYGLGVFFASFAEGNLTVLYLTYGLIAGTGVGFGYIAPVAALPGWFPDYGSMPALVESYYGSRDVGSIYGSIITASGVAGFGAPLLLAWLVDTAGSYSPALYVTAGVMLAGAVITLAIGPPGFPQCTEVGAAPDSRRVR